MVEQQSVKCTEVNFLCVQKQHRKQNLAAILIMEVVRRSNLRGIFQGVYTGGSIQPFPIGQG